MKQVAFRILFAMFIFIIKYTKSLISTPAERKRLGRELAKRYDIPLVNEEQEEELARLVLGVINDFLPENPGTGNGRPEKVKKGKKPQESTVFGKLEEIKD